MSLRRGVQIVTAEDIAFYHATLFITLDSLVQFNCDISRNTHVGIGLIIWEAYTLSGTHTAAEDILIDDAAGEAIDKCSKVMGLGYPGGPIIDKLARQGNPKAFHFAQPHIKGFDYSFSGLKTSFLYQLRDWVKEDPDFIEKNKEDLAASLEFTIVDILMKKLRLAVKETRIKDVALAGGVSANNGLRNAFKHHAKRFGWNIYIPKFSYTTDNAAMIAITGYYKFLDGVFCNIDAPAFSKITFK